MQLTLRNGPCTAVADTRGGELVSFQAGGTEYIWGGDPAYWSGRNPILFPIVGSLKNGRVRLDRQDYEMARHGFARRSEFTLAARGDSFAVLELRESPDTLARFPRPFLLRVRHELLDGGFSTTFEVENPGPDTLPFCIGGHTAFRCPIHEGEGFEDYQLLFDQAEDAVPLCPTADGLLNRNRTGPALSGRSIPLTHEPFDRLDTLIFQNPRSTGVALVHKDTGRGVHMDFSGFPLVAFWTPSHANAPFICLEPWLGCAAYEDEDGEFTHKPCCTTLLPGERKVLRYTVRTVQPEFKETERNV